MIHYLVIGHACDEESEWQFTDSDTGEVKF